MGVGAGSGEIGVGSSVPVVARRWSLHDSLLLKSAAAKQTRKREETAQNRADNDPGAIAALLLLRLRGLRLQEKLDAGNVGRGLDRRKP